MALGNTPRRETTISVEAGKSYSFGIWFTTKDSTPVDLDGSEVRFVATEGQSRRGTVVLSTVAVPMLDSTNMVQFEFQADDLALTPGPYAYDVTLITPSQYSVPVLKGILEVGANSDYETSNVFTDVSTGTDVTVRLDGNDVVEVTIERVDGLFRLTQELLEKFREEMAAYKAHIDAKAAAAEDAALTAQRLSDEMAEWLRQVGFPFWKGTQEEYDRISKKEPNWLYLITA